MKLRRLVFALCVVGTVSAVAAPPGPHAQVAASPDTRAARVEQGLLPGIVIAGRPLPVKTLAARMAELKTPGVSVAVINGGKIEWARGYGVMDMGGSAPVTPRTLFQAASLSKPVAALAALRLVEQGKLALDQDVNARLTSWKVPANEFTGTEKVTLRRLLSHSSGLTVSGFPGYSADAPVPALVEILDGQRPANTAAIRADVVPGTIWRYSGGGYTVMQQLLTDVTGRPFPLLLEDMVLQPIGMKDSSYEQPLPAPRRALAASGHRADGVLLPGRYHTYPEMASAGLWTTPTDLARFLIEIQQALQGKSKVLTTATAREMVTVQKGSYGLGLGLEGAGPS
ncbi:MAG TPA: serine hydrolase domain-containing protein, partial [Vicinamibacterales bacterium]|nr:serine hydrolase domain-containing protein [Vicinamibacterales bacterium]